MKDKTIKAKYGLVIMDDRAVIIFSTNPEYYGGELMGGYSKNSSGKNALSSSSSKAVSRVHLGQK